MEAGVQGCRMPIWPHLRHEQRLRQAPGCRMWAILGAQGAQASSHVTICLTRHAVTVCVVSHLCSSSPAHPHCLHQYCPCCP